MPDIHMPRIERLGEQLTSLLGKETTVTESAGANVFEGDAHTARYFTRDDKLAVLCQVDLAVAAFLGAALAMVPVGGAEEAVKEGELGANLVDAYSEVANIMAGLLCSDGYPHVRWISIARSLDALTDDDKAVVANPKKRIDVQIQIEGYGGGKMTILSADLG